MKIIFMNTAPYPYLKEGSNLYESFDLAAKHLYSPSLCADAKKFIRENVDLSNLKDVDLILCSELQRSKETTDLIKELINKNVQIKSTSLLNEIVYAMTQLMTEKEFITDVKPYELKNKDGKSFIINVNIRLAVERFADALAKNKLTENQKLLTARINDLLIYLRKSSASKILCVSHGFFLTTLKLYLKDCNVFSNDALSKIFREGKVTSCKSFEINLETFNKNSCKVNI